MSEFLYIIYSKTKSIFGDLTKYNMQYLVTALHYSVDFIFSCPLQSWVSLWNFEISRGSMMRPEWPKLASLAQRIGTL